MTERVEARYNDHKKGTLARQILMTEKEEVRGSYRQWQVPSLCFSCPVFPVYTSVHIRKASMFQYNGAREKESRCVTSNAEAVKRVQTWRWLFRW